MANKWQAKITNKPQIQQTIFVVAFAAVGSILLFNTFASPNTAPVTHKNSIPVDSRDIAKQKAAEAALKLATLSPQLQLGAQDLRHNPGKQASLGPKLKQLASDRKQYIKTLMQNDPATARQYVLGNGALATLKSAGGDVEQPTTISGSFGFSQVEDKDGDHMYATLTAADGKTYTIDDDTTYSNISFGSTVRATGYVLDDQILLASKTGTVPTNSFTYLAPDVSGDTTNTTATSPLSVTAAASVSPTTGPIVDAVMFANFSGGDTAAVDIAAYEKLYSGNPGQDLASFVSENSYGKATLAPDYYDLGTFSSITCGDISSQVKAMKAALDAQTTKTYQVYTYISNCGYYGTASRSGGYPPTIVISGMPKLFGHAHELSHTLGSFLGHGGYLDCGTDVFIPPQSYTFNSTPCVGQEYQDHYDTLGDTVAHLSPSHKLDPGWLDSSQVTTVTSAGTTSYVLSPYEKAGGMVALKIPRGNSGSYFTLEYRQKTGFDANISNSGVQGGLLRLAGYSYWGPGGGADSNLIDMTPESVAPTAGWWPTDDGIDSALVPGKSFTDSEYGITVKVTSIDTSGLHADVTINTTCNRATPTVSTLTPTLQTVKPGESASYSFTVTDNDSAGCSSADFRYLQPPDTNFQASNGGNLHSYVSVTTSPSYWTLTPGASKTITLTVVTTPSTPDARYGHYYNGYVSLGSIASSTYGSTNVDVQGAELDVVSSADTTPPTAPTGLTATALGATTATVNWAPSSDNVGVIGYKIIVNNSSLYSTAQPSLFMNNLLPGTTYSFAIQASDHQQNFSPVSTVTVTTPAKTDTVAPSWVGGIKAAASDHDLKISWQAPPDNKGVVYYTVGGASCGSNPIPVTFTTQDYVDCVGANYRYSGAYSLLISACDADGNCSRDLNGLGASEFKTALQGDAQAPTQPTNAYVSSVTQAGTVIRWQPSTDDKAIAGYNVYRGPSKIGYTTDTTYTDTAMKSPNAVYRIQAVDSEGSVSQVTDNFSASISYSSWLSPTSDTTPPTASFTSPANGATVSGTINLTASASDASGVSGISYVLDGSFYVGDSSTAPYTTSLDTTKFADGPHQLLIVAKDNISIPNFGSSTPLTVYFQNIPSDTSAPSTPASLSATAPSALQVNLTWPASSDNVRVIGYTVLRNGVVIGNVLGNAFTDLTVLPNTAYSYQVVANDAAGNVSPASSQSVTTPNLADTTAPSAPSNFTASAASTSQINLSWSASIDDVGVAGYDIYRNGTKIATVTTTSYGDGNLTASTTYSYYVIAKDAAGNASPASQTVNATTQAVPVSATALQGLVTDTSNTPLMGATVTLSIGRTSQTITSDSTGRYYIGNLKPNTYTVKYSKKGYSTISQSITIQSGQTLTQNETLAKSGGKK